MGRALGRSWAASWAGFHAALSYAVELELLPANPIHNIHWRTPKTTAAVNPATVASPAQVQAILTQVSRTRPELAPFFGCLYYAALRVIRRGLPGRRSRGRLGGGCGL